MDTPDQIAQFTLNIMHNTGLHPVAAAHWMVSQIAEYRSRWMAGEPGRDQLLRVGIYLCRQVAELPRR